MSIIFAHRRNWRRAFVCCRGTSEIVKNLNNLKGVSIYVELTCATETNTPSTLFSNYPKVESFSI